MASNQRQLIFGVSDGEGVGPLVVHWPSGHTDRFEEVPQDSELFLLEGAAQLVRIPR